MEYKFKQVSDVEAIEIIKNNPNVIVDFSAEWCTPCKLLTPTLNDFAESNEDVQVLKINVDEYPNYCADNKVRNIPAILFFKDGEYKDRLVGNVSASVLKDMKEKTF